VYDLGAEWKKWTGLPFVFAVWVAQRTTPVAQALKRARLADCVARLGLKHLDELAAQAARATGVSAPQCRSTSTISIIACPTRTSRA
jgi:chorismate dehydratase